MDEQIASKGTLVMKFGGTSVGSPQAVAQATRVVKETLAEWPRLVVVTSAMSGVTDLLLESAARAISGDLDFLQAAASHLRSQHQLVLQQLIPDADYRREVEAEIHRLLNEFSSLCRAISVIGESSPRALDAVASLGERVCVRMLEGVLRSAGLPAVAVEATSLIVTDAQFGGAHPDLAASSECTRGVLGKLLEAGQIPVVTGFIGATPQGVTTTLGRGGSDYSAAILGAILPAEQVWIWTDVDGVMSADPRLVPQARTIPLLSYREIAELAYYGAKVVHPKTIRPVIEAGIGLRVCNTFNPDHPGTRLVANLSEEQVGLYQNGKIKGVTAIHNQSLITIEGRGMLGVPGVAARAFAAVAATGTSVPLITQASSEQSICFAVPVEVAGRVVASLEETFAMELNRRDIDRVWASTQVTIVTVVGAGMRNTPGIAGRIFGKLGAEQVNVIAIAQGSSEVAVSLVVDAADAEATLRGLHELIV